MKIPCLLFLSAAAFGQSTGSVSVSVVDRVSKEPVKNADVLLMRTDSFRVLTGASLPSEPPKPQSGRTGATGTFTAEALQPGTYHLQVQHPSYPVRGPIVQIIPIRAGERASVTVQLTPGALVTGRVTDGDGDPIGGCFVSAMPARSRQRTGMVGMTQPTNEEGGYRVYAIPPGRYYLIASCHQPPPQPRPLSSKAALHATRMYERVFYPNVTERTAAQILDLTAGSTKSGIDFSMSTTPVVRVAGIVRGENVSDRPDFNLLLQPRATDEMAFARHARVDPATGRFEFQAVVPGSYTLLAITNNEPLIGARVSISIGDKDPDPIIVYVKRASEIEGLIEWEEPREGKPPKAALQFMPAEPIGLAAPRVAVKDDGTFKVSGVLPGIWRLQIWPPDVYVKAVTVDGRDVDSQAIDFTSGAGPMRITLGNKPGTIDGSIKGDSRNGGIKYVLLLPADESVFAGPRSSTQTAIDGTFTFARVAPGKYRVVAVESEIHSQDLLDAAAERGEEVTVEEGKTVTVEIPLMAEE